MAAQKGSDILIKIGDGGTPAEVFTSAAGLRTKTIKFNSEAVDVTNSDSTNKWRELLAGAGIKSCSVSGAGIFKDKTNADLFRAAFFAGTIGNYQIVIPGFGTVQAAFQIADLQYSGEHNKETDFQLTLESSGDLAWTLA